MTGAPLSRVLFSSAREKWATPPEVYAALDAEFGFTLDPCPIDYEPGVSPNGLSMAWLGARVYCNPPYGPGIGAWLAKRREADLAVYLLPARTDTRWWHDHAMQADEIRFLRGRLKFGGQSNPAPFPSCLLVYRNGTERAPPSPDLLDILDCGTNALRDSVLASGNDPRTNLHWINKVRRDAGLVSP